MTPSGSLRDRVLDGAASWVWLPPDAVDHVTPEYRLVLYPHAASVAWSRTSRPVPALVADVLADLARIDPSRTSLRWWTSGRTEPTATAEALQALGFRVAEQVEVLAADLTEIDILDAAIGVPPQVRVTFCDDEAAIRLAASVGAAAFGEDPPTPAQLAESVEALLEGRETGRWRFRQVIAWLDGEPVGSAGCSLVDGVLRLWGGAVLPAARGRGAYRAMVAARCRFGARHGQHTALVKARTTTSAPIMRRVGFTAFDVETCLERETAPAA